MVNPLPNKLFLDFAKKVETLYVFEELDGVIETHCKALGIKVIGKELFGLLGEFSQDTVKEKILGQRPKVNSTDLEIPPRPPALCAGCPHRSLYYSLKTIGCYVSGDIGCYTLGALAPLSMMDICVCMGASVSALHGAAKVWGEEFSKKAVAVIGDSTFIHSGITGLIDIAYNKGISTVIVLDNSITGMTGNQNNPANGNTICGEETTSVDLEALARACGYNSVRVVDPYKMKETTAVIKEELEKAEPSLIISRRPCVLLKTFKGAPAYEFKDCKKCKMCMKIGCPAISFNENGAVIDNTLCVGCGVCTEMCKFDCIKGGK